MTLGACQTGPSQCRLQSAVQLSVGYSRQFTHAATRTPRHTRKHHARSPRHAALRTLRHARKHHAPSPMYAAPRTAPRHSTHAAPRMQAPRTKLHARRATHCGTQLHAQRVTHVAPRTQPHARSPTHAAPRTPNHVRNAALAAWQLATPPSRTQCRRSPTHAAPRTPRHARLATHAAQRTQCHARSPTHATPYARSPTPAASPPSREQRRARREVGRVEGSSISRCQQNDNNLAIKNLNAQSSMTHHLLHNHHKAEICREIARNSVNFLFIL